MAHKSQTHTCSCTLQVKQQVESQIKCTCLALTPLTCPYLLTTLLSRLQRSRLSHTSVSIAPADYASWHDVRTELMAEAKAGLKARVESEMAAGEHQSNHESFNTP